MTVFTLGHSTRGLDEILALLREHAVALLVDVRRFPASRRQPHVGREALEPVLAAAGIAYLHEPDLGGHRAPQPDSRNTAWRVAGFRGYADHMATGAFREALERLIEQAGRCVTAVLCAEALPWRCHRQLLADALVARGIEVRHILAPRKVEPHRLHPAARLVEGRLVYPSDPQLGLSG